jgi:hypothetical protein
MKSFDEHLVDINILEWPMQWANAMQVRTGADFAELSDYAHRRVLWHSADGKWGSLQDTLKYLLGMEHL